MPIRLTILLIFAIPVLSVPSVAQAADRGDWRYGVEARERVQYFNNTEFDARATVDDWLWTQRIALSAEGPLAPSVKASLKLQSALSSSAQTSPIDSNVLDVRVAHLDLGSDAHYLRIGRQELFLGTQRLIGTRDGTNVRRGWDGVRASTELGDWKLSVLAVALVEVVPKGVFNDRSDERRSLAGVYASGPTRAGNMDLYLLYAETDDRATIEGLADQKRYSAGLRSFGERGQIFWNWEAIYQWGEHGDLDISAWSLATNTGYRFETPWSPELMLSANIASGDGQSGDDKLGTFDALYPRGNYFSDAAVLGPANFYNFNPYLTLSPSDRLNLSLDVNWFWRLEMADGVYGAPGNVLRRPGGSKSNFVATGASAGARYQINDQLSAEIIYAHNAPGDFISDTGASDPVDFLELSLRFTL